MGAAMNIDSDFVGKVAGGVAALGAALYGALRMVRGHQREDKALEATDDAMQQVISTLREEVKRLSDRLEAVEKQNEMCEQRNRELAEEVLLLKARMGELQ